jgi:hypothetical protein
MAASPVEESLNPVIPSEAEGPSPTRKPPNQTTQGQINFHRARITQQVILSIVRLTTAPLEIVCTTDLRAHRNRRDPSPDSG